VLSVPRPSSTAGLHHTGVPVQRGALRVLFTVCARWFRGLVNPRYLYLLETEDGVSRTRDIDGHTVGVAVCRAWLTGEAVDFDATVADGSTVCAARQAVARDLEHRAGAG
jgi:hypothetical protein